MFIFVVSFLTGTIKIINILSHYNFQHILSISIFCRLMQSNRNRKLRKMNSFNDFKIENCGDSREKFHHILENLNWNVSKIKLIRNNSRQANIFFFEKINSNFTSTSKLNKSTVISKSSCSVKMKLIICYNSLFALEQLQSTLML